MNRIFWDAIFLITGSFLTYVTGQENSTIAASTPGMTAATTANTSTTISTTSTTISTTNTTTTTTTTATTTAATNTTTSTIPVKKLVAAAVRSHFDDCPDSHSHFCFHGTCRFLILEETPACVCHPGFVGMRCEHADLLAVVATNHRQQTAATVLVLCVIGSVLTMLLCSLIHCWWQSERHRRRHALHCAAEKPGSAPPGRGSCCHHSESVV